MCHDLGPGPRGAYRTQRHWRGAGTAAAVGAVMKPFQRLPSVPSLSPSPSGLSTKAASRELELVYEAEGTAAGAPPAPSPSHVEIHTRVAAISAAGVKDLVDVTTPITSFGADDLAPAEEQGHGQKDHVLTRVRRYLEQKIIM